MIISHCIFIYEGTMRVFEKFDVEKKQHNIKLFGDDTYNNTYTFSYSNFNIASYVVDNPESCFLIRVKGDSMVGASINNGDILLVDKYKTVKDGDIVVAEINSKLVVKKIKFEEHCVALISENPNYLPIIVSKNDNFKIWGVVRSAIKTV
jgi:DNA polymerase V